MARFVLAHPEPSRVADATSLALDPAHPVVRRIAANAHSDLLALERTEGDSGKLRTVITVDQVRRLVSFFGSTAGEGGWRVCIVDSADELKYPEGSNALLKMLEEPPARSLFLLVSHAPGRLLPTIRSRCRRLTLKPLGQGDVVRAISVALQADAADPAIVKAAAAARGSVARALALAGGPMLALRDKVAELLAALPATDPNALHALGDQLDRDRGLLEVFVGAVRDWLSNRLDAQANGPRMNDLANLARTAELWDRLNQSARDVEAYNLERKPLVFAVFGLLAEASRG
jgi:DNA polymerase-3 subunit delta'